MYLLFDSDTVNVGSGRRNIFFLCICGRNCISFISIDIVFVVVMVGDVLKLPSDGDFFWL